MIIIKSEKEIGIMRQGGHLLAEVMDLVGEFIVPGKSTHEVNELARKLIFDRGGFPVFEGQGEPDNPFPGAICISLNNEIVHGIPRKDRIIKEGDLVKIDVGMEYGGLITDMARTFGVGNISADAEKLVNATRECLDEGINMIFPGGKLSRYSEAVEKYVRARGFSVVRDLVGHGVGHELHEDPQILNYRARIKDTVIEEGMTLALEPMINAGTYAIKILPDGWTFATRDGKLSAHFEDTIAVTKKGVEILTRK